MTSRLLEEKRYVLIIVASLNKRCVDYIIDLIKIFQDFIIVFSYLYILHFFKWKCFNITEEKCLCYQIEVTFLKIK